MAIPRFVVDSNSPVGLAMRAACLLRKQRGPEPPTEAAVAVGNADALREASLPSTTETSSGVPLQVGGASVPVGVRDGDDERSGGDENAGIPAEESMSFDGEILGNDEEEEEWMLGGNGRGKLNPTLFSFWLAANLPLDDDARQELLILDSVVMRLRWEEYRNREGGLHLSLKLWLYSCVLLYIWELSEYWLGGGCTHL